MTMGLYYIATNPLKATLKKCAVEAILHPCPVYGCAVIRPKPPGVIRDAVRFRYHR